MCAVRFTTGYVRLVGQEPAPSRAVRGDMRGWIVTDEGDRWSVKLDVRDLGGIWIPLFAVGRPLLLRGFGWSLLGWF